MSDEPLDSAVLPTVPTSVSLPLAVYASLFGIFFITFIVLRPRKSWRRWFSPRPYYLSNTANRTYNLNRADYPFSRYNLPNKLCQLPEIGSSSSWEPYQLRVLLRKEQRAIAAANNAGANASAAIASASSLEEPSGATHNSPAVSRTVDSSGSAIDIPPDDVPLTTEPIPNEGSKVSLVFGSALARRITAAQRDLKSRLGQAKTDRPSDADHPVSSETTQDDEDRPDSIAGSIEDEEELRDRNSESTNPGTHESASVNIAPIVTISELPNDDAALPALTTTSTFVDIRTSSPSPGDMTLLYPHAGGASQSPVSPSLTLDPQSATSINTTNLESRAPGGEQDAQQSEPIDRIPNWQFWRALGQLHESSDEAVVGTAGLDAYIVSDSRTEESCVLPLVLVDLHDLAQHLLFLRSAFFIFAVLCALSFVIAAPLNRAGGEAVIQAALASNSTSLDIATLSSLSFQNIPANSNLLIGHLILTWVFEFFVMFSLTRFWMRAVKARIEVIERGIGEGEWAREAGWLEAESRLRDENERPGSAASISVTDVLLAGHRSPSPALDNGLRKRHNVSFGGSEGRDYSPVPGGDRTLKSTNDQLLESVNSMTVKAEDAIRVSETLNAQDMPRQGNGSPQFLSRFSHRDGRPHFSSTASIRNIFDALLDFNPFEAVATSLHRVLGFQDRARDADESRAKTPKGSWMAAGLSFSLEDVEFDQNQVQTEVGGNGGRVPAPFHPSVYVSPVLHLLSPRASSVDLRTIKIEGLPSHVLRAASISGVPVRQALRVWCEEVLDLGNVRAVTVVARGKRVKELAATLKRRYHVIRNLEKDRKRWQVNARTSKRWSVLGLQSSRTIKDARSVRPKRAIRFGGEKVDIIDEEERELKELNEIVRSLRRRITERLDGATSGNLDSTRIHSGLEWTGDLTDKTPKESLEELIIDTSARQAGAHHQGDATTATPVDTEDEDEDNALQNAEIAFVTFEKASHAAMAARAIMSRYPQFPRVKVSTAPHPVDLHWPNLTSYIATSRTSRLLVQVFVWVALLALVLLYAVAVTALASLLSLESISFLIPSLAPSIEALSPTVSSFIKGVIPTLVVQVILALLPLVIRTLSVLQGFHSVPEVELWVWTKMYFFLIVNVFFIILFTDSIWNTLSTLYNNFQNIPVTLANAAVNIAPFYINYINQSTLVGIPLTLIINTDALIVWLRKLFSDSELRTRRTRADMNWPGYLRQLLASGTPSNVLIYGIALIYSQIQPVVVLCAVFYFLFNYYAFKYTILYVRMPDTVSRGSGYGSFGYAGLISRRVIFSQIIHIIVMMGGVSFKGWYYASPMFCLPLLGIVLFWGYYLSTYMEPWEGYVSIEGAKIVEDRVRRAKQRYLAMGFDWRRLNVTPNPDTVTRSTYQTPVERIPGVLNPVLPVKKSDLGAELDPQSQSYQNPLLVGRVPELWLDKDS
ncbi:hypothetical protein HDU93_001472 [Gonapodya sp. JEL0774]|nr:hypothetical protein HDU93_001472 [Gonapodya sp. JEL0774]